MSLLEDLQTTLSELDIPVETGIFSDKARNSISLSFLFPIPLTFMRITHPASMCRKRGCPFTTAVIQLPRKLIRLLLRDDFTITGRLYNGYETETGYHHYTVDVAKHYEMEV